MKNEERGKSNIMDFFRFANIKLGDVLSVTGLMVYYTFSDIWRYHHKYHHWPSIKLIIINNFDFGFLILLPGILYIFIAWVHYATQRPFRIYSYKTQAVIFITSEILLFPISITLFNTKTLLGFAPYSLLEYIKHNYKLFGLMLYPLMFIIWLFIASAKRGSDDF